MSNPSPPNIPMDLKLKIIGWVRSDIKTLKQAPKQGAEGGVDAWIDMEPFVSDALLRLTPGKPYDLLTWLHLADRTCMQVHPRGNRENPLTGVFSTHSPSRPNPIGLHRVTLLSVEMDPLRIRVSPLEAIDGTPVVDIKSGFNHSE